MITIDFETKPIDGNTSYNPPEPVGVSIKIGDAPSKYYAWGHPTKNNHTFERARKEVLTWFNSKHPLLFHNSKFDISVAMAYMGAEMPHPSRIHDTQFLLFLNDPYSQNLSLKPNAEKILGLPPDEQDALQEWIMQNTPCRSRKEAGEWIWAAPGDLVGRYAQGDTDRTFGLFQVLMPRIVEQGMEDAYKRECELMPITYYSEKRGVRVDVERLNKDLITYEKTLIKCENMLLKKLGLKALDFAKNQELAQALENAGLIGTWTYTATGKKSTAKDALEKAVNDKSTLELLRYRAAMANCLQTFARPWAELSSGDGRIHTTWNQVRTHDKEDSHSKGSRTGRLSASKPSLMNVANEFRIAIPKGLPPPPLMRVYLLPEEGHVWLKRDFSSQEVRWLAHFEDGELLEAYQENPGLDPHTMAQGLVKDITGIEYPRKDIKITAFSIVYGSGAKSLGEQLGREQHEAALIKDGYLRALPGVRRLQKEVTQRGRTGNTIRTWGGRVYTAEPPKLIKGRMMDFSYKLLNYLIQGSAADQTKRCVCDWVNASPPDDVFLATVHDEINISAPAECAEDSMRILREVMDQPISDCPMRSEGFAGPNWYDIEAVE